MDLFDPIVWRRFWIPKIRKSSGGIFSFVIDYANCFKGALRYTIVKKYESVYKNICSCRAAHMRIVASQIMRDETSYVLYMWGVVTLLRR